MPVLLRRATEADAKHVESLLAELGYPSKEADVRHRLRHSLRSDTSCFLLAQSASEVVGLVWPNSFPIFHAARRFAGSLVSTSRRSIVARVSVKSFLPGRPISHANIIAQALRSPARSIVSTRTGSTSGSDSPEPRSDSSRPYKQRGDIVVAPLAARSRRNAATCAVRGVQGLYSMTSSAIASSRSGIVKPSAFAVLRLTANSYLTGFCTGRLAGFSPLRMRST